MSVRRVERNQTVSALGTFNQCSRARPSALTGSLGPSLEVERYVAAMCGLALMLVLVVGAAGYAGISRAFRAAAGAANSAYLAPDGSEQMRSKPVHISSRFSVQTPVTE